MAVYTGPITGAPSSPGSPDPLPDNTDPTPPASTDPIDSLTGDQRDAYEAIRQIMENAGLGTLAPVLLQYVQQGYNQDTILLLIQDTPEYKQRFAGNEIRKQKGLPVLSPGEYLSVETSYRQAMMAAGLPPGFYDSYTDFTNWIGKDVSPTEMNQRIDLARQEMYDKGEDWRNQMRAYYPELGDGDLVAYFLDDSKALPLLQSQTRRTDLGVAAQRAGLALTEARAAEIDQAGVTGSQAAGGFQTAAGMTDAFGRLGNIYGDFYSQADAENEVFGLSGSTESTNKRKSLASQERASFGGSGGLNSQSLGSKPR